MACKIRGGTQIEFAIAVAVICALIVIALPKISQLPVYARMAKLKTLRASVISASRMVHGALLTRSGKGDSKVCAGRNGVADNLGGATGTLCMDEGIINLVYGYPAVTEFANTGILSAAGLTIAFNPTVAQLQARGYDYIKVGNVATFQVIGGSDVRHCFFTYTEATENSEPVVSAIVTTGC